jgi:predicted molibdopterin-dependent oxidoreductase YjgC
VSFTLEGAEVTGSEGDTVAAALLAAGHMTLRNSVASGQPRGPYCMMGACFECLVEIDGIPNRQACMVEVHEGMRVMPMHGARGKSGAVDE